MPLPDNFSPWEHLQDQIRLIHNREVADYFRDAADDDISTARSSLKTACKMVDTDTAVMTLLRLWLFDFTAGRGRRLEPNVFSESTTQLNYKVLRKNKPMITLYFKEDIEDVDPGYRRLEGEISFRLMNQTTTTISKSEAESYARKIKTAFGTGNGFVWKKGRTLCSYTDWDRGYQLQLLVRNETEGRRVVEQVLDIQSHTPDWAHFEVKENAEPGQAFPAVPPRETILGKSRKLPRRRPVADLRYQYSALRVSGVGKPLVLHDRSYRFRDALEK
jgi:hypothetical protein